MPNIIINNYCNQKCSYCFANKNMEQTLQKNMNLFTFLKILKFLKSQNDTNVRILGGEPLLSPHIKNFLQISVKWWFKIIIFSNINIPTQRFQEIFKHFSKKDNIRINCNINDWNFYNPQELENISCNMRFAKTQGIELILWYNITNPNTDFNFHINLARKHNIKTINLKITNTSIWEQQIINNTDRKLWQFLFNIIKQYHTEFQFSISCWLPKNIFTNDEIIYLKKYTNITLRFWCSANDWKFDFNTDGRIFKCFPLESIFHKEEFKKYHINNLLSWDLKISTIKHEFRKLHSNWECSAHFFKQSNN